MKRHQLEHVLRAASRITEESDILVIGSQSILGSIPDERLPPEASASIEVDVTFFDDPDDAKSDAVDGALGELSPFHETFGYYAQGVSVTTAILPAGWQKRVVELRTMNTEPGRGLCLERHDCVLAKLAAGRPKDYAFATALRAAGLIDLDVLRQRLDTLPADPRAVERIHAWLNE
jgi:hypothetical protein